MSEILRKRVEMKLKPLEDIDDVIISERTADSFTVNYNDKEWVLWVDTGCWVSADQFSSDDEYCYGDINAFIVKNIRPPENLPRNHGKIWTRKEQDKLYDLILKDFTVEHSAEALGRSAYSVLLKTEHLLKCELKDFLLDKTSWSRPLSELVKESEK